jgi:hypothetical protein
MSQSQVRIWPAFLATKEKLRDRFLFVGKVVDINNPDSFIFYLIEILTPWFPSTKVEKIISDILESNFKSTNFGLPEFEQALREINDSLGILSQEGESDWIGNLNAIIGLVSSDQLHISLTGNISGYLIRKNKITSITDGLSQEYDSNPLKSFINITSGELQHSDRVIIANVSLYDFLSIDRIRKIITELPAKSAIFEMHRGLRKIKAEEASAIVLEASDVDPEPSLKDLPEILFLDKGVKGWLEKSIEKATPVAKNLYRDIVAALKKGASKSKEGVMGAKHKWDQSYGPRTKKFLRQAKDTTQNKLSHINFKTSSSDQYKASNIRVNPYNKKPSNFSKNALNFFSKVTIIFKKENRRYLYVALVVLLIFGGYLKIRANNISKSKVSQENQAISSLDEAENLLNSAAEDIALKKGDGKDKLTRALDIVNNAEKYASTHDKAVELKQKIQDKIDQVIGAVRFRNIKPIFSINGEIKQNILAGTKIYSITKDGKVYATDTRDKEPSLVASVGQDGSKIVDASYTDTLDLIFIYLDDQKMLSLDVAKDTVGKTQLASDPNKNWEKAVAISAYTNNIYLLDPESGEVWKHSEQDSGFSEGADYLDTRKVSLKNGVDLTIDGNIYVLNRDATVAKFTRGSFDQDFKIQPIPSPFDKISDPVSIFTDQDTNYIYIFDKSGNRIIRFDKTGEYSTQYIFEGITIDQFLVNPRVQKMWVVSGKDIYEVSI